MRSYEGNYSAFEEARQREYEQHVEAWRRQQEYVDKVQRDISAIKSGARSMELSTTPRQPGLRRLARKKAALAKSREKKLERYMESGERVDKPKPAWWLKLDFGPAPAGGRSVLRVDDVSFAYPDSPTLFENVSFDVQYGDRIALVGPNGMGKTTLLRLIEGEAFAKVGHHPPGRERASRCAVSGAGNPRSHSDSAGHCAARARHE